MHPDSQLHVPGDAVARDALLRRVRTLAELDHARLVGVAEADVRGDSSLVVTWRPGPATDLATVLAVRGRLSPAEAAGVLVGVAQALAAMHSADLVHGPLSALDVMLGPGGDAQLRPRLDGPHDGTTADDVLAAALLVDGLLGHRSGDDDEATALRAVLAPALAPDPLVRPEAGTLAAWAHDAVPPEMVRLPEPATLAVAALGGAAAARAGAGTPGSGPRHRRAYRGAAGSGRRAPTRAPVRPRRHPAPGGPARVVVGVGVVVAGVGALAGVLLQLQGPAPSPLVEADGARAPAAASVQAASMPGGRDAVLDRDDPAAAAAVLTKRRIGLLDGSSGDPDAGALEAVDVLGSPAHASDTALVERLTAQGVSLTGADVVVHDSEVAERADGRAVVTVEYDVGAHEQRTADGTITAVPASGARTSTLSLAWTDSGWRVSEVH